MYLFNFFLDVITVSFLKVEVNAFEPTFFSFVDLIVIFESFLHPLKAPAPIVVIFFPMVTFFSLSSPLKAFLLMEVTGYVFAPAFTDAGMTIDAAVFFCFAAPRHTAVAFPDLETESL